MGIADDLERLRELHAAGDLTDEEYAQAKAAVLGQSQAGPTAGGNAESYFESASPNASHDGWQAPGAGYFQDDSAPRREARRDGAQSRARNSMSGWLSVNEWAMVLHLSQFAGYIAPVLGFVVPILIWQILKDDLPSLDRHGRIVMNWVISELIYLVVAFLLAFVGIGFVLLPVIGVLGIVFPMIAALSANGGKTWEYPFSIRFFSLADAHSDGEWD
jgi:uncharacterized Tic20 family protein